MLAKICEGIPDALAQLKDKGATFLAEYKYDGQRAQIHLLPDGSVSPLRCVCSAAGMASYWLFNMRIAMHLIANVSWDRGRKPGQTGLLEAPCQSASCCQLMQAGRHLVKVIPLHCAGSRPTSLACLPVRLAQLCCR